MNAWGARDLFPFEAFGCSQELTMDHTVLYQPAREHSRVDKGLFLQDIIGKSLS